MHPPGQRAIADAVLRSEHLVPLRVCVPDACSRHGEVPEPPDAKVRLTSILRPRIDVRARDNRLWEVEGRHEEVCLVPACVIEAVGGLIRLWRRVRPITGCEVPGATRLEVEDRRQRVLHALLLCGAAEEDEVERTLQREVHRVKEHELQARLPILAPVLGLLQCPDADVGADKSHVLDARNEVLPARVAAGHVQQRGDVELPKYPPEALAHGHCALGCVLKATPCRKVVEGLAPLHHVVEEVP
mmetsp:Transcript_80972/g.223945  ORF Transcript_80972/g.223945 Transcript_80972/m.223945 type:complete len:244 (+) Transcript_80972:426-1157(+)